MQNKLIKNAEQALYALYERNQPKILFVTHNRGGGVEKHIRELIACLPERIEAIILQPASDGSKCVVIECRHESLLCFDYENEIELLEQFLSGINLVHLHFHHTKGLSQAVMMCLTRLGLSWDYTIHDYFTVCPQISLIDKQGRYCQEKGLEDCASCLNERPVLENISIQQWREKHQFFVEKAQRCFVPSADVKQRMQKYFPDAKYVIVYHELEHETVPRLTDDVQDKIKLKNIQLKVLVIGALTPMKGANRLEEIAIHAKKSGLPVDFILLGEAYRKLICKPLSQLKVMGQYKDENLQALIKHTRADVIWFPACWPETYSYTLSAAIVSGMPIVAPDIGAFQERLHRRALSWILPWDLGVCAYNDFFVSLQKRLQEQHNETFDQQFSAKIDSVLLSKMDNFNYRTKYIDIGKIKRPIQKGEPLYLYQQFKNNTRPQIGLRSILKYRSLILLNGMRKTGFFSTIVKYIPQSFQTQLKSWLLNESKK